MELAILKSVLTALTTLIAMVGSLQADVDALKQKANATVFGAVPVLSSPLSVDGSDTYTGRVPVRSANSNVANFRIAATSTAEAIMCNITNGTNAATYVLGWGATAGATTTIITSRDVAANVHFNLSATSTLTSTTILGGTDGVIPPGYLNVRTTRGDNAMSGGCTFKVVR